MPKPTTSIILTSLSLSLTIPPTLAGNGGAEGWCNFWNDNTCTQRAGTVAYQIENNGVFQNGGPYYNCAGGDEWTLLSYPPGDSAGDHPNHCAVFTKNDAYQYNGQWPGACIHLDDKGFTTGDGGYYRLSQEVTCPNGLGKRDGISDNATESDQSGVTSTASKLPRRAGFSSLAREEAALSKRDDASLYFYNDELGQERSGSVGYNSQNQGCFENGGAYFDYMGEDYDWHLEQWSGIDNNACGVTKWKCATAQDINTAVSKTPWQGPAHVDDLGFHSGFGSYKIGRGGCP